MSGLPACACSRVSAAQFYVYSKKRFRPRMPAVPGCRCLRGQFNAYQRLNGVGLLRRQSAILLRSAVLWDSPLDDPRIPESPIFVLVLVGRILVSMGARRSDPDHGGVRSVLSGLDHSNTLPGGFRSCLPVDLVYV